MLTFQDLYTDTQDWVQDTDATALRVIKSGINQGVKKFAGVMDPEWRNIRKVFSTVASQQYYQMPPDCIRLKSVTLEVGDVVYSLREIPDESTWLDLNTLTQTSDIPEYFYVMGNNEFGLFPTPSSALASAGTINYEPRIRDMTTADYITGTVTVTNGSATVVGSGTTFTSLMVGRYFHIVDPAGDGMWYKVTAFTDTTHITIENYYDGLTASGQSFRIGESPTIPEEFHEALKDYAVMRYYQYRRDESTANVHKSIFDEFVILCKTKYGQKTLGTYHRPMPRRNRWAYNRDLKVTP